MGSISANAALPIQNTIAATGLVKPKDIGIACKRIEQEAESYENSAADNEREHMRNTVHEMLIKFVPAAFLFVVINRLLFTFVGVIYRGFSVNDSFDKLLGLVYSV